MSGLKTRASEYLNKYVFIDFLPCCDHWLLYAYKKHD